MVVLFTGDESKLNVKDINHYKNLCIHEADKEKWDLKIKAQVQGREAD